MEGSRALVDDNGDILLCPSNCRQGSTIPVYDVRAHAVKERIVIPHVNFWVESVSWEFAPHKRAVGSSPQKDDLIALFEVDPLAGVRCVQVFWRADAGRGGGGDREQKPALFVCLYVSPTPD